MPKKTVFPEIPERETIYATLIPDRESVFYITADIGRMEYRLYRKSDKGVILTGTAETPAELEERYIEWGPIRDLNDTIYQNDITVTPFELQAHEDNRLGIVRPSASAGGEKEEKSDEHTEDGKH